jgi:hypothetical protein
LRFNIEYVVKSALRRSHKQPLQLVIDADQLPAYEQAASMTDIPLTIITTSGEACRMHSGSLYVLPDGKVEVQIGTIFTGDLSEFWDIVEQKGKA